MKITIASLVGGTFLLLATQMFAQTTGTSHPEALDDNITVAAPQAPIVHAPPAAPVLHSHAIEEQPHVYEARPPQVAEVTRPTETVPDPDAGIVTTYPYAENALPLGTIMKARLVGKLSTDTTRQGSHFIATLSQNVEHNGRVILPAGSSLEGRVTEVRSGSRISGGAAIHLEPETVTLPDGTLYHIAANVIDLDAGHSAHVNSEGTITGGNHTTGHVVTLGATTGGGAIAGAVVGGAPGAAVGAGIGAGVGTVLWLRQDRQQTLDEGTELVFSLNRPMGLTPETPIRR